MTAQYKKVEKDGDVESGMTSPFLDDPKKDHTFAEVPPALSMAQSRYGRQPEDHLLFAILTTVFCCIPCGIVAIVKSVDVRNKWVTGDIIGANRSSRDAKRYSVCSLVSGIIVISIYIVFIVLLVAWGTKLSSTIMEEAAVNQQSAPSDG